MYTSLTIKSDPTAFLDLENSSHEVIIEVTATKNPSRFFLSMNEKGTASKKDNLG